MDKKNVINYVIILSGMFIASALLLAVMSVVIWKTGAGAGVVGGCITVVYIISNFLAVLWQEGKQANINLYGV